ncbi:asparagine--tRNA ligase, partial [Salmonella enterica subsp. enterica serovar Infantis]
GEKDAIARLERVVSTDVAQVDYTDAGANLERCGKPLENPVCWGVDLSTEHEPSNAEEQFKAPVVLKNYPKEIKALYM